MGVGSGSGNSISFSTIRDFYGDTNPVSLSEFNRSSNNSGLVDSTFAGASTATTSNGASTKNDFAITQSTGTAFTGGFVTASNNATIHRRITFSNSGSTITGTTSYTVTADDATIGIFAPLETQDANDQNPKSGTLVINVNGGSSISCSATGSSETPTNVHFQGPAAFGASLTGVAGFSSSISPHSTLSTGDVINIVSFSGQGGGLGSVKTQRRTGVTIYDITFTNNNNTGDTYTLASSSTRLDSTDASQLVYAAGTSRQVKNDSTSNQWTIAYDNVSGSGSGTAGDIGVTVTSQTDTRTTATGFVSGQNTICTLKVPNLSGLSFVSATGSAQEPNNDGSSGVTLKLNGTTVASNQVSESSGSSVTYTGSASANDTFQVLGGQSGRQLSITFTTPSRSVVFQNNGSSSITLGGSTTPGGQRTIAAGASSSAQAAGSSGGFNNNQNWQIFFDTSTGDCNVGIPTTIGVGNPVNMDLFNTVTTPVG